MDSTEQRPDSPKNIYLKNQKLRGEVDDLKAMVNGLILQLNQVTEKLQNVENNVAHVKEESNNQVRNLDLKIAGLQEDINEKLNHVKTDVAHFKHESNNQLSNLDSKIAGSQREVQEEINESRHVESGVINCGAMQNWPVHGTYRWYVERIPFHRPYSRIPRVHLSICHVYIENRALFYVEVDGVDAEGFTAKVRQAWDVPSYWGGSLYSMQLSWISIPA